MYPVRCLFGPRIHAAGNPGWQVLEVLPLTCYLNLSPEYLQSSIWTTTPYLPQYLSDPLPLYGLTFPYLKPTPLR